MWRSGRLPAAEPPLGILRMAEQAVVGVEVGSLSSMNVQNGAKPETV
jgi:hypothetical protein